MESPIGSWRGSRNRHDGGIKFGVVVKKTEHVGSGLTKTSVPARVKDGNHPTSGQTQESGRKQEARKDLGTPPKGHMRGSVGGSVDGCPNGRRQKREMTEGCQ